MKKLITLLLLCISVAGTGQVLNGTVTGTDKRKLDNATIYNVTNGGHTHSNEWGLFRLTDARKGDSLKIVHVAYATTYAMVAGDSIHIVLAPAGFQLQDVTINASVRHLNVIAGIDLQTSPVNSSQELLRTVPGLFIGQHAGGGKAEQLFLRGFDIDHGTDINISVDGMPVNMVSHAHGQGYADLHFLIPESVEKIDFDKGPYYANKGNLATAGYVAFQTKERLDHSSVTLEGGKFGTFRTLGMFDLVNTEKQSAYVAAEYRMTDGYFETPQHFNRMNVMGKYTAWLASHDKIAIGFSHLNSKWDASGQIPQRAVDEGLITRFGAIDNTEGGHTQRTNINLQHTKQVDDNTYIRNTAFYSRYGFELYSNFTFFLNDPVNGDQIRQKENRNLYGFESEFNKRLYWGQAPVNIQAGTGLRYDDVKDIELSHTVNRKTTIEQKMLGDINESNAYAYVSGDITLGKWLINPAVRIDYLKFDYADKLAATYSSQSQSKGVVSPKLNFLYNYHKDLQFFLKLGKGFHSNDTRVVVAQNGKEILPAAYGGDLGFIWKPFPRMVLNTAIWYLHLQQEFVYVGDEGIVEPGGRTRRQGLDLGLRYQVGKYVFVNSDLTYTHARATDEAKGQDYIPLASKMTLTGGISVKYPSGIAGSIKTRYLGHRPANEDNSIVAKGYCVTDANISYTYGHFTLGVAAENIFNTAWNETQFATESRLKNEAAPVTEIHFTPGTPFNIRGMITCRF